MVGRLLLLVSCIICYLRLYCLKPQQPDIHTSFKAWCPHSSFCDKDHSGPARQSEEEKSMEKFEPCCSSCSCNKECGRARNCCKYEFDLYRLDETLDTICKQLRISPDMGIAGLPYYHIIDKCPNRSEICRSIDDETYRPVYAKDSKMLYYNERCASCHGQEDLIIFPSMLACRNQFLSIFDSLRHKNKDRVSSGCVLNWIPPDDLDLSTEICYPYIVNTCSPRYKSAHMFDVLCGMLNATFRTDDNRVFSNVFCYLCTYLVHDYDQEDLYKEFEICPKVTKNRGTSDKSFVILLESTKTSLPNNGRTETEENTPTWCKTVAGKVDCRPVFCPEGQMYVGGKCQMFGKQWYFKMLQINVKLTIPIGYNNILPENIFSNNGAFDGRIYLRRPGLQDSQLTLSYNLDTETSTIRYFLAMLYYEKKTIPPKKFMDEIRWSLGTRWKLYWNKQEYNLLPRLNRYLRYQRLLSGSNAPIALSQERITSKEQITTKEEIHFLAGHKTVYELEDERESFFLTKLFFCRLVELHEDEYEDHVGRLTLHNGSKYLEEGEFTWAHITNEEHRPLICLQDLPGYSNLSNGKQTNMYLWLIGAGIFVLLYVPEILGFSGSSP